MSDGKICRLQSAKNLATPSEEEDSEYEDIVTTKVKKRKRDTEVEKSKAKRTKLNPKPQIPKTHPPRAIPAKKLPKKRPRVSKDVQGLPPGKPPKRFKPSKSKASSIPSRR